MPSLLRFSSVPSMWRSLSSSLNSFVDTCCDLNLIVFPIERLWVRRDGLSSALLCLENSRRRVHKKRYVGMQAVIMVMASSVELHRIKDTVSYV